MPTFAYQQMNMTADKIRIKDVAKLAGVSVGTVDRVLHNRPNVSEEARTKVEKAIKEMDYRPNVYASALAYNKTYNFYCIIPKHISEAYWEEIEEGAMSARDKRRDFHVSLKMMYYRRFETNTFIDVTNTCLNEHPDGVIIVPSTLELTRNFTDKLHEMGIPFILLDSYMPDLKPLSFFGQDSFCSGYFAGRMLMMVAYKETEIMLMKQMHNGNVASKQQENRETGFKHYMRDHFPNVKITELNLPLEESRKKYDTLLNDFFETHPHVHHWTSCIYDLYAIAFCHHVGFGWFAVGSEQYFHTMQLCHLLMVDGFQAHSEQSFTLHTVVHDISQAIEGITFCQFLLSLVDSSGHSKAKATAAVYFYL